MRNKDNHIYFLFYENLPYMIECITKPSMKINCSGSYYPMQKTNIDAGQNLLSMPREIRISNKSKKKEK